MDAPFSGKFVLRLQPEMHQRLVEKAKSQKKSLNTICLHLLSSGLDHPSEGRLSLRFDPTVKTIKQKWGGDLLGIVLFGSQATGQATASSDIDLLIVLSEKITLGRALYRIWDDHLALRAPLTINPQFVHLPTQTAEAGGLWFEVAINGDILWDPRGILKKFLDRLKGEIANDKIRRYWSHGQPYWAWRNHEKFDAHR